MAFHLQLAQLFTKAASQLSVNNDGKKTVIGVVYRSPNSTETNNEKLLKCIQELSNRNLVIMGDFKYPNIDWNNLHTIRYGLDFMNLIMDIFLCQHVNFPTRENNILDLFISIVLSW